MGLVLIAALVGLFSLVILLLKLAGWLIMTWLQFLGIVVFALVANIVFVRLLATKRNR